MGTIQEKEGGRGEDGGWGLELDSSGGSGSGLGHLLERYGGEMIETKINIKSDLLEIEDLCF